MRTDFEKKRFDWFLFIIILFLLGLGLAMCASSSFVRSSYQAKDSVAQSLMIKQFGAAGLGLVAMIFFSTVSYKFWKRFAGVAFFVALALNFFTAFFGAEENGAKRWFAIAGHNIFQPSEVMKIAVILYFAAILSDKDFGKISRTPNGIITLFCPLGLALLSVLAQKHTSATIIIALIAFVMILFTSLTRSFKIVIVILFAAVIVAVLIFKDVLFDHVKIRLMVYEHTHFGIINAEGVPEAYLDQIQNSIWAIGSGGFFGKGFGNSIQKYSYLPESYNDFIFAVVAEELGFFGVVLIILLFATLILRGIKIASHADDDFGMFLAIGFVSMIAIQTFLNLSVVSALIPVTGISLPFFSYGGTAMLIVLSMMGILLNIASQADYSKIGG